MMGPLAILQLRAEARALRYREHELELEEAINPLWDFAYAKQLNPKVAIAIIKKAFDEVVQN